MDGFLHCDQAITLIKHEKASEGDFYTCYAIPEASWFSSLSISSSGDGAQPVNSFTCRIPAKHMPTGISPSPGDYVVRGTLAAMTMPGDLKDREHFRITSIGDNRRGLLSHWKVIGQ